MIANWPYIGEDWNKLFDNFSIVIVTRGIPLSFNFHNFWYFMWIELYKFRFIVVTVKCSFRFIMHIAQLDHYIVRRLFCNGSLFDLKWKYYYWWNVFLPECMDYQLLSLKTPIGRNSFVRLISFETKHSITFWIKDRNKKEIVKIYNWPRVNKRSDVVLIEFGRYNLVSKLVEVFIWRKW